MADLGTRGSHGADAVGRGTAMDGAMDKRGRRSWSERMVVLVPYLWLAAFFLLPFLIVLKISFSHTAIAQPPYTPVFDLAAGWSGFAQALSALSFENY